MDAKIVNIFDFHKILTPHSIEKFLFTAFYFIWQHIEPLVNSVLRLIEADAQEREQASDFKHRILFHCTVLSVSFIIPNLSKTYKTGAVSKIDTAPFVYNINIFILA